MLEKPIITLTTDFGLRDPFVGIMKGVITGINPEAQIIDLSHNISPHNVFEASQVLSMSYKYFPSTTIHVVVVDPGVGGVRKPLLVVTDDYYFIGPDNGVFTHVIEKENHNSMFKVIHLTVSHYFLSKVGFTFHGRDIFSPVAAWLSKGVESSQFGDPINDYALISTTKTKAIDKSTIDGEVVYIDSFGNAITNISKDDLDKVSPGFSKEKIKVIYKGNQIKFSNYYAEIEGFNLSAILDSFGFIELSLYKESASDKFGIKTGDKVRIMVS